MIKGSLKDVSLPGLIECLANQSNRSYRVKVERGTAHGDLFVSNGHLVSADFGLLSGEDALCEMMTWEEGAFTIERLSSRLEAGLDKNINLRLQQGATFADHASFLLENNVGLQTVIRSSPTFGTPEWQEFSKLQPLQREDFLILGWLSDGRTMRQAMREFAFDLVLSTAILYRLVLTRSVEVVRAGASVEPAGDRSESRATGGAAPPAVSERIVSTVSAPAPESSAAVPLRPVHNAEGARAGSDATSRRTTLLPIITIDIERLMKATFTISEFGFLALKNPALDESIRTLLLKVESGEALGGVVDQGTRHPASVLSTYRYCMERGYITNPDPVLPLTADLLLGRTELDQYLLQRRRLTGDQVRDLIEAAAAEGIALAEMLVKSHYLTKDDLACVIREQLRFAMH